MALKMSCLQGWGCIGSVECLCYGPVSSLLPLILPPLLVHSFRWDTAQNSAMDSLTWPAIRNDLKCDVQMQRVYY